MPTFELSANGGTYQVEAPNEQAAYDAFTQAFPQQQAPDEGSSLSGTAKSLGVGLAQGAIGLAGIPGDLAHLWAKAARVSDAPEASFGSGAIQKAIEGQTGEFYKPQGFAEKLANTAGQFAPAMVGGPGSLAARLATRVAVPALASETAG